jgi:hypothetical protein
MVSTVLRCSSRAMVSYHGLELLKKPNRYSAELHATSLQLVSQQYMRMLRRSSSAVVRCQLMMLAYWQLIMLAYWQLIMLAYWQLIMLAYWQLILLAYWQLFLLAYSLASCAAGIQRHRLAALQPHE